MKISEKIVFGIFIILLIGFLVLQQLLIQDNCRNEKLENSVKELSLKIDSLSNVRDSLIIKIDNDKVKIVELERKYEANRDSIIIQSVNADWSQFTEYLSKHNGLLNNNNR